MQRGINEPASKPYVSKRLDSRLERNVKHIMKVTLTTDTNQYNNSAVKDKAKAVAQSTLATVQDTVQVGLAKTQDTLQTGLSNAQDVLQSGLDVVQETLSKNV